MCQIMNRLFIKCDMYCEGSVIIPKVLKRGLHVLWPLIPNIVFTFLFCC